jgi:hypothetical protein
MNHTVFPEAKLILLILLLCDHDQWMVLVQRYLRAALSRYPEVIDSVGLRACQAVYLTLEAWLVRCSTGSCGSSTR